MHPPEFSREQERVLALVATLALHMLQHFQQGSLIGIPICLPSGSEGWDEGGGGRSDGGVLIMSWKLSSVAGSFEI